MNEDTYKMLRHHLEDMDRKKDHSNYQTFSDVIDALVGLRDMFNQEEPFGDKHSLGISTKQYLTEENTIQGWIDICSEFCDILERKEYD